MEVALVPMTGKPSLYPGLFLFTTPCRLVRPVQNVELGREELIGTMEQVRCWVVCDIRTFLAAAFLRWEYRVRATASKRKPKLPSATETGFPALAQEPEGFLPAPPAHPGSVTVPANGGPVQMLKARSFPSPSHVAQGTCGVVYEGLRFPQTHSEPGQQS